MIREPLVAGQFYPADREACLLGLRACLPSAPGSEAPTGPAIGGIVPHAGWAFSGQVAARVWVALAERSSPDTVVLLGAAHRACDARAVLDECQAWRSPLGDVDLDVSLAEALLSRPHLVRRDSQVHAREHSLEVQVPFIQQLFPRARLLPLVVPAHSSALQLGHTLADLVIERGARVVVVASSDLTHYGPRYGLTAQGVGPAGVTWAHEQNDRRMIDLILRFDAEAVIPEAARQLNACGPGAIAATLAAARSLGATRAVLLEQTSSAEVSSRRGLPCGEDSVGYAGIQLGLSATADPAQEQAPGAVRPPGA